MTAPSGSGAQAAFPAVIFNPPGLSAISYRVGDYTSFREALLQSLPNEVELNGWRPTDNGDLALQLLEWWAYIADILTFYNERIANNSYLGTVVLPAAPQPQKGTAAAPVTASSGTPGLPDNATLIAHVTGYRSSPGIAATGLLAVLVNAKTSISLPPNFAVQNNPGPGQQPQVFQADPSTNTYLPTNSGGAVPVDVSCPTFFSSTGVETNPALSPPSNGPLLQGTVSSIKSGDLVVVAQSAVPLSNSSSFAAIVQAVTSETDPRGRTNTRLAFGSLTVPSSFTPKPNPPDVTSCEVLRSIQSATTYSLGGAPVLTAALPAVSPTPVPLQLSPLAGVHLSSLVRDISVGDVVVLEVITTANPPPTGSFTYITSAVSDYQETIWYANADDPTTTPEAPPAGSTTRPPTAIPIPIPHSFLTLETNALDQIVEPTHVTRVFYGYRPVSVLLDEMPASPINANDISSYILKPDGVMKPKAQAGATVLIEGADGLGATATLTAASPITVQSSDTTPLALPIRLLFNVFNVTAGKTVTNEVLGSGDATVASQSFTLQKAPLTYIAGTNPSQPTSTLQVQVDNVPWTEVPSFSGQPAGAKVFVTKEDMSQKTTVTFGDGINGSRLTTGAGNVTATYRYGSGPGAPSLGGPAPGTLVTVLTPYPGLGSVRNPVPMTGGAAPSTPVQVQQSAANSMLTFGRAVSPTDYAAIAVQAPSVTRAQAQAGWDPQGHRTAIRVYVAGGPNAVSEAQGALLTAADPNRQVLVSQATEIDLELSFVVTYDPAFNPLAIENGIITALTDPITGLFAPSKSEIGAPLYDSQIYAACRGVSGVLAVRGLTVSNITSLSPSAWTSAPVLAGVVHSPGPGGFFAVTPDAINISLEAGNG